MKTAADVRREKQLAGMSAAQVNKSLQRAKQDRKTLERMERRRMAAANRREKARLMAGVQTRLDGETDEFNRLAWERAGVVSQ